MISRIANKNLRFCSRVVSLILKEIEKKLEIGLSGKDLEKIALEIMKEKKVKSSSFGYKNFPSHICVAVNDTLTHGIPNYLPFKNGDIVTVDVACNYHGFHVDAARTFLVSDEFSQQDFLEKKELIEVTRNCLTNAVNSIIPGKTTNKDIGISIQKYVEEKGYFVIKEYGGHGIGNLLHQEPFIPNCLIEEMEETVIEPGTVICIEPLVQTKNNKIKVSSDYVVSSKNGELNAHFEHTVLIGLKDVEILV